MNKELTRKFELLTNLSELYNRDLSKGVIGMMLNSLEEISAEHLEEAIKRLIKTADYMPTIADIRDKVFSEIDGSPPKRQNVRCLTEEELEELKKEQPSLYYGDGVFYSER